ncbi:MAG: L-fucose:H+ symporter permease [Bacteroidetes bacterium]|nr:L-fucose:H+ symporter permease [Bacteroidota bacterium]
MTTQTITNIKTKQSAGYRVAFVLIVSLFFLWALTSNLLPTLIPHLKKVCRLSNFESSLLDTSYWSAYFIMAIPAAMIMKKTSYKTGIVIGLMIAAAGSLLFIPAASIREFWFFLLANFILASGMTFLETAANPYISVLGDPSTAAQRLNFAQAFNGLGAFISASVLSKVILSGKEFSEDQLNAMPVDKVNAYLNSEASALNIPYLCIGLLLILVALLFIFQKFPKLEEEKEKAISLNVSVLKKSHLAWGVITQFFYVGGQVCISSFFIRYCRSVGETENRATTYLGGLLLFFMLGRYVGSFLMKKLAPAKMLVFYSIANILLISYMVLVGGHLSIFSLFGVEFFMSIMYPTIFSLAIKDLGADTKSASAFMVMSIIGGALVPPVMGYCIDIWNIQLAYSIPLVCFAVVAYYGLVKHRVTN